MEKLPYLTQEERKQEIWHRCNNFDFKSRADLSGGVDITPFYSKDVPSINALANDTATFTLWWSMVFLGRLNGFLGIDTIEFRVHIEKIGAQ